MSKLLSVRNLLREEGEGGECSFRKKESLRYTKALSVSYSGLTGSPSLQKEPTIPEKLIKRGRGEN